MVMGEKKEEGMDYWTSLVSGDRMTVVDSRRRGHWDIRDSEASSDSRKRPKVNEVQHC